MKRARIKTVRARQVLSNRGFPAVEALVTTEGGVTASAVCTAGVTIGSHEIAFAYDGGEKYGGKGVSSAVHNVNEIIAPALRGVDASQQFLCDHIMLNIGGPNAKDRLGGNAVAAVSAAILKAGAESLDIPLYRHIGGAAAVTLPAASYGCAGGSNRYIREKSAGTKPTYSFISYDFPTFSEAVYALYDVVQAWQEKMAREFGLTAGNANRSYVTAGFVSVPQGIIQSDFELWDMIAETIAKCGYEGKIGLQGDIAADSYYDNKTGLYSGLFDTTPRGRDEVIEVVKVMAEKYPFVIIEDPLEENDFEGHALITKEVDVQIVGDDLFTTDTKRVAQGVKSGACNCVLLKVNQIGTISESLEMIQFAYRNGYGVMPCSSRGEGASIVDYSVGINAGTIREACLGSAGSRFLAIEKELGKSAVFAGKRGLKGRRFQKQGA
ncbi:MAG: Enolase [Desulfovibrio sp.]